MIEIKHSNLTLIVGAPRSGTYLLLTRLSNEFDIAFPVETHFIPLFYRFLYLWGDLSLLKNRRKLLLAIYTFLEIWTIRSERGRDPEKIYDASLLATKDDFELIVNQSENYQEIVHNMFLSFAARKNSTCYGDKSAFYSHIPLELLDDAVNPIRVVHIVRDGRDVSYSWRNIFTGPATVVDSAIQWSKHVLEKERWGKKNSTNYMRVHYEELISNESATLSSIGLFLGLPERALKNNYPSLEKILAKGDMHKKIDGPMIRNNKNLWRINMSSSDINLFEYFAGKALRELGYPLISKEQSSLKKFWYTNLYLCSKIRKVVSVRFWKLQVKNHLPLLIWLTDIIGLPLAKIVNWRHK